MKQLSINKVSTNLQIVASFALLILALLVVAFLSATPTPSSRAITAGSEVTVNIPTILSLTLDNGDSTTTDNDVLFNVTASDMGSLLTKNLAITAQTNNATGYTLTFNDTDADNNLTHTINSTYTVPSVSANTAPASFPDNKWGYLYASGTITDTTNPNNSTNTNYHPVPLLSAPGTLEITTAPSTATTNMTFATKITEATPAGTYQDNLVFTLIANYVPRYPYIQDNLTTWCAAQPTPNAFKSDGTTINADVPTIKMFDKRDDEPYIIKKLADGNCWMTDNLRLGKTAIEIEPTLSDVPSGTSFTLPQAATTVSASNYDVLELFTQNNANYGNYYNWYTATATQGTLNGVTGGAETSQSICPKGMTIPSGMPITSLSQNATDGSVKNWNNLLQLYGITGNDIDEDLLIATSSPLNFVPSGAVAGSLGFMEQGADGWWWSSTSSISTVSIRPEYMAMDISVSSVRGVTYNSQASHDSKNTGLSVRCVTR